MLRLLLLALLVAAATPAWAQTQTVLFPGQSGSALLASIRAQYRPTSVTGTNDDLYATIDRTTVGGQDGVVCVYTGYFVPFDCNPNCDPSQDVFNGGAGINQEHTWPQSLLTGQAVSDLHNLFPSQVAANADRGNLKFAEIPDATTTRWYLGGPPYTQTAIPTASIDAYSELRSSTAWEPREDHKGNVARALFYMRAVYDTQTNGSFPFDAVQQRTLYDWHYADAITEADQARSARVAPFQSGKENPFVLDSTLARRAFFPQIVVADEPGAEAGPSALVLAGAHPFRDEARLTLRLTAPSAVRAEAFDALGRRVGMLAEGTFAAGSHPLVLDGRALAPGVYVVRVVAGASVLSQRLVRAR